MIRFLRGRFDIVHAHPGTVARLAAVAARVPVIVSTLHSVYDWKPPLWSGSERLLNQYTDRFVAVSDAVNESAAKFYRLDASRLITIYNGIDTTAFSPEPSQRQDARVTLGLDPSRHWVAAACHLVPNKRPNLLVRALALVRNHGVDAGLVIAGDGPMRPELETLARDLGVRDAVKFLGVTNLMPTLYRACDAFAHAAVREGLGLAIIEAMSTGLPVIAARAAALENFLDHERNALLAPLDDADGLAEGLARVLTDPPLAATLGEAGRRTAVERFAVDRMVRDYERLYEDAFATATPAPHEREAPTGRAAGG